MSLSAGAKLAHYEVVEPIGEGGMGEVYRARDTKLDRDVAVKVLPEEFAGDAERVARFEREAKFLASLNHPNIAVLHGLEQNDGKPFLVMELVEGETLTERLARGAIPVGEAIPLFIQIADGLEAAHTKGIIHRDLKPANIKIGPDGHPKILDFGLAKAYRGESRSPSLSESPTATKGTAVGVVLGTAAYMSPEQARGQTLDQRTDIWAFGCVLYEALTGRAAFLGDTVSDTIAAVLDQEPDWVRLPSGAPTSLRKLLARCLTKDRNRRLHDIADGRIELESPLGELEERDPLSPFRREAIAWSLAALFGVAALTFALSYFAEAPAEDTNVVHVTVETDGETTPVVSPDGRHVAFVAVQGGAGEIVIRSLDSPDARILSGTEGARNLFWSPDSRFLAFTADGKLKTIPATGGPTSIVCDASAGRGGTWSVAGDIVFQPTNRDGLYVVSASGGVPVPVTKLDESLNENSHRYPSFLPDGFHFLFTARAATSEETGIYVSSLESSQPKRLLTAQSNAVYAPQGYLLFVTRGNLMAQPFDTQRLELHGDAAPVVQRVAHSPESALAPFSLSRDGSVLAYQSGNIDYRLVWFDRSGARLEEVGPSGGYIQVRLSPNGERAAVTQPDSRTGNRSVWLMDLPRGIPTRFTSEPSQAFYPVWSPDGRGLAFASDRSGSADIYFKNMAGAEVESSRLISSAQTLPTDWTSDGRIVLERRDSSPADLWILYGEADERAESLEETDFEEYQARFSPDGRWLSFTSDESGNSEIYVRHLSTNAGVGPSVVRVSEDGGIESRWSRNGKELVYLDPRNRLMGVDVELGSTFKASTPTVRFEPCPGVQSQGRQSYDVTTDGERFLFICRSRPTTSRLHIVVNWHKELKRLVPTRN